MEYRNPTYTADGRINMEVYQEETARWLPFTASPHDPEPLGRELFAKASAGEVAPYIPPEPPPVLTAEQKVDALLAKHGLTRQEFKQVLGPLLGISLGLNL